MKLLFDHEIKTFLENVPLYVSREYDLSGVNRRDIRIREIDAFCEICGLLRPFHTTKSIGGGAGYSTDITDILCPSLKDETICLEFQCVSCKRSKREYHVEQIVSEKTVKLQKYGELPRRRIARTQVLQKFLKDDLDNYEKAAVCLSTGYGIAAFAYFRKIVENNISKLLDLVQEDAESSIASTEITAALGELRKNSPMNKKIPIANKALPKYLKPDGLNPLGRLYKVLSEGVHDLSEEECLDKAKATSDCLEYLVSELASRKKHRTRFKSMVGGI